MMTEAVPIIKGSILKSLINHLKGELTPAQMAEVLAALTVDERALVSGPILVSQHVPEALANRLTALGAKAKGEALETFGNRAGKAAVADTVGLYRYLVMVRSPGAMLAKASSTWSSVHNTGSLIVEDQSSAGARVTLRDYACDVAHCARLTGWFAGLAEMTGAKSVSVTHDRCMAQGAPDCSWTLRWD